MSKFDDVFRTMYNINGLSLTALITYCVAFSSFFHEAWRGEMSLIYFISVSWVIGISGIYFAISFWLANHPRKDRGAKVIDIKDRKRPTMRELIHISLECIGVIVVIVSTVGILEYIVS